MKNDQINDRNFIPILANYSKSAKYANNRINQVLKLKYNTINNYHKSQSADKNDNIFQWMTLAYSEKENPSSPNNETSLMALLAPTSLM